MTYHTCMGLIWLDGIDSNLLCQHRIGQFRKVQLWYLRIHKEHESVIQVHCICLYLLQTKLYLSVFDSFVTTLWKTSKRTMAVFFRNHQLITRRDEMRPTRFRWPITTGPMLLGVRCFSGTWLLDVLWTISSIQKDQIPEFPNRRHLEHVKNYVPMKVFSEALG